MTNTPQTITYVSVVSCETVKISLAMAVLHDLSEKTADIMNVLHKSTLWKKVLHHPRAGIWTGQREVGCDCLVIVRD